MPTQTCTRTPMLTWSVISPLVAAPRCPLNGPGSGSRQRMPRIRAAVGEPHAAYAPLDTLLEIRHSECVGMLTLGLVRRVQPTSAQAGHSRKLLLLCRRYSWSLSMSPLSKCLRRMLTDVPRHIIVSKPPQLAHPSVSPKC